MSLTTAHPAANAQPAAAQPSQAAPSPSPAVSGLVARFTAPVGAHPPVQPSLGEALLNCKTPIANYLVNVAALLASAPETAGATLLAGAKAFATATSLELCISQNEAQQVVDGNRANLAADCRNAGAVPVTAMDGSVVCAK